MASAEDDGGGPGALVPATEWRVNGTDDRCAAVSRRMRIRTGVRADGRPHVTPAGPSKSPTTGHSAVLVVNDCQGSAR